MDLKKTIILPLDDTAQERLADILKNIPAVLMIIRGKPTDDQVDLADKMAGGPSVFRQVVWVKDPTSIAPIINTLAKAQGVTFDDNTAALFISFNDKINGTLQSFSDFSKATISMGFLQAQVDMQ